MNRLRAILAVVVLGSAAFAEPSPKYETLTLQAGENHVTSMAIDERLGFGYLATAADTFKYSLEGSSGTIAWVRLTPFQRKGTLRLKSGENAIHTAAVDAARGEGYFGVFGDPNRGVPASVVKMALPAGRWQGSMSLGKGEYGVSSVALNPKTGTGLFGTLYGTVVGMRLADLSPIGSLGLQKEDNAFQCGVVDPAGRFGYFATTSGNIMKIDIKEMVPAGNMTLIRQGKGFRAAAMTADGKMAYFVTQGSPIQVFAIDLESFKLVKALPLAEGEENPIAIFVNRGGSRAWVVTGTRPCRVVTLHLKPLERSGALTLPASLGDPAVSALEERTQSLFIAFDGTPGRLVRLHATSLANP